MLGFGIGLGWTMLTKGDNWKYAVGFGLAHKGTRGYVWKGVRWAAPTVWGGLKVLGSDALIVGRAATGTKTAAVVGRGVMITAGVGVGYTTGAVAGTVIVSQAEEAGLVYEGATADVLDFYMGEGHYWEQGEKPTPGYFNVPGNVGFIAKHYWNKWT